MTEEPKRSSAVIMSKRSNVFYLEHAKVFQADDRIVYLTDSGQDVEQMFNIPDKNTALLMLGKGTSITDAAARKLAESNVMLAFCGSGGSPLFSAIDMVFMPPQDEYRPTGYAQNWIMRWMDESQRMDMARHFLCKRIELAVSTWGKMDMTIPQSQVEDFLSGIDRCQTTTQLLLAEAAWAKRLYAVLAKRFRLPFAREEGKRANETVADRVNGFLDHGNYIAYGYAAVVLHTLGIPFSFPVLHGKTRRGALVFDVADIIKDALVMPLAFQFGMDSRKKDSAFRAELIAKAQEMVVMDVLFDTVKAVCVRAEA